jgi:UDP-glucose 4-epimerase
VNPIGQRAAPASLAGARVLVTGGTGSFGHVVARRLLSANCREIRVLSRDEAKQYAMRHAIDDRRLTFHLGDVRDRACVDASMRGIDLVFHAAALKQVPNCERFPDQAAMTNVFGSLNVMRSAMAARVNRVVCLSTDKAVQPVNAMGMTKALMEKLVQAEAALTESETVLCAVRYGNVLCSRGSVVPLFFEQAAAGRPLTVTVPEMTRFLMRLDDAVGLVERALEQGQPGDIFVRKSSACTIAVLAEAVCRLTGSREKVQILGPRPGEKLHETLATADEVRVALDLGDVLRIPHNPTDLVDPNPALQVPCTGADFTSANTTQIPLEGVIALLRGLPQLADSLARVGRGAGHRREAVGAV